VSQLTSCYLLADPKAESKNWDMKRALIRLTILALAVGAVPMISGCVSHGYASGGVVVEAGPPSPDLGYYYYPRDGYVWVEGRWAWDGAQWQWRPGYWIEARPGFVYVQGYWDYYGGQYLWYPGRWMHDRPGYLWARGYWDWYGGRYHWRHGHWERHRAGHYWHQGHWGGNGGQRRWVQGRWSRQPPHVRDHRSRGGTRLPPPRTNTRVRSHRGR